MKESSVFRKRLLKVNNYGFGEQAVSKRIKS